MVLKLNKLTRPTIALTLVESTATIKKIIEEASKRLELKLLPDNVFLCQVNCPTRC
jgi:hypothetical protein